MPTKLLKYTRYLEVEAEIAGYTRVFQWVTTAVKKRRHVEASGSSSEIVDSDKEN